MFSPANFSLLLQKCLKSKALKPCKQVHALILTSNINTNLLSLHSKLIATYAASGDVVSAKLIFLNTKTPNVFAYNWMISSLTFLGLYREAIRYFSALFQGSIDCHYRTPNNYTFSLVLKACIGLMDVQKGKELHGMIFKMGFATGVSVCNSLIDMYAKCGDIVYATKVFDKMTDRDVTTWTSLISWHCNAGRIETALFLFERMKLEGLKPNDFTWNALVSGYARRGDCDSSSELFSRMSKEGMVPDLVTWNAMISGLVQAEKINEAFEAFRNMLVVGIRPNQVTITGILPACGLIGSFRTGTEIHGLIYRMELNVNVFVGSALIDMYSKCGAVKDAWVVFNTSPVKNVAVWNAMIGCYGKHGFVESAVKLFERMKDEGVRANEVTLTSVLSACGHGGLVDEGLEIFRSVRDSHEVRVSKEHYACVVDLLCRSGKMDEAYKMVMEMSEGVTDSIIGAFFNGCKIHERADLAEKVGDIVLRKDVNCKPGGFVTLSNIYAANGEWKEVEILRKVMRDDNVFKLPASTWIYKLN